MKRAKPKPKRRPKRRPRRVKTSVEKLHALLNPGRDVKGTGLKAFPQWIPESESSRAVSAARMEEIYGVTGIQAVTPEVMDAYTSGYVSGKNAVLIHDEGVWSPSLAAYMRRPNPADLVRGWREDE